LKTPICTFDARVGILCGKCEAKLQSGRLKKTDVEGAIKITKLAEFDQEINKFTMAGASKVDDEFILKLRGSDISILHANNALLKKIEDEFKSKVWFVEAEASDRRFIENLIYPARVITVNLIWLPDGSKLTKVIVSTLNIQELQRNTEKIKRIAKEIRDLELLLEIQRQIR
jgi:transcription antitermination factor NusA-like protein